MIHALDTSLDGYQMSADGQVLGSNTSYIYGKFIKMLNFEGDEADEINQCKMYHVTL